MAKSDYRRALIMLRALEKGYAGHARLERRTLAGSLDFSIGAPNDRENLAAALIGTRGARTVAKALGTFRRDSRGQLGLMASFDPRNVAGLDLNDVTAAVIARLEPGRVTPVLYGWLGGNRALSWEEVKLRFAEAYPYCRPTPAETAPRSTAPSAERPGVHNNGAETAPESNAEQNEAAPQTEGISAAPNAAQTQTDQHNETAEHNAPAQGDQAGNGAGAQSNQAEDNANAQGDQAGNSAGVRSNLTGNSAGAQGNIAGNSAGTQGGLAENSAGTQGNIAGNGADAQDNLDRNGAGAQSNIAGNGAGAQGGLAENGAGAQGNNAGNDAGAQGNIAGNGASAQGNIAGNGASVQDNIDRNGAGAQGNIAGNGAGAQGGLAGNGAGARGDMAGGDADIQAQPDALSPPRRHAASYLNIDMSAPWPSDIESLKLLFLTSPRYAPFPLEDYVFIRAGMAQETGIDHCAVGVKAVNGRLVSVCYAIPMAYTPEPPAGLEGYSWIGDSNQGWWVTCDALESETPNA